MLITPMWLKRFIGNAQHLAIHRIVSTNVKLMHVNSSPHRSCLACDLDRNAKSPPNRKALTARSKGGCWGRGPEWLRAHTCKP